MEDNFTRQTEEIEALTSIYGNDWKFEDDERRQFSINILESNITVTLYVNLPNDYPSESPPVYQLSAPVLSKGDKQCLGLKLDEVYLENIGETVIFQWIERIREFLQDKKFTLETNRPTETLNEAIHLEQIQNCNQTLNVPPLEIFHSEIISDRKSDFQGHVCRVAAWEDVQQALKQLYQNKKISKATHNMYAYIIFNEQKKVLLQDCEDDGENQAGKRLLHLLQILNIQNVMVIVSRWYGGILLGSERFKHINNAARQALEIAGFIPDVNPGKKKK